jgi:molybdenum cofactor cytidylyltransferase
MNPGNGSISPRVVALVLASGASSRMQRTKALLDFDGQTCLALVLASCAGAPVAGIVVVTAGGAAGAAVRAAVPAAAGAILAENPQPERGMLSSLQVGLRALPAGSEAFLIFPVDYPLVRAEDVAALIAAFGARRSAGQRIFVPSCHHRRGHPVLVDAALAAEFLALGPEETARTVMGAHAADTVFVDAPDRVLADMDTPEDYERCLVRYRGGG